MAFTTRELVKLMLKIPVAITEHDDLIDDLAESANEIVLVRIHLAGMTTQSYTDVIDVEESGCSHILLNRRPVRSITSVSDDGTALAASDYYWKDFGSVKLANSGATFSMGPQKVSVVYTAGFDSRPPDLSRAATLIAATGFNAGPNAGLKSVKIGSYSIGIADEAYPAEVERILAGYRPAFALE